MKERKKETNKQTKKKGSAPSLKNVTGEINIIKFNVRASYESTIQTLGLGASRYVGRGEKETKLENNETRLSSLSLGRLGTIEH